MKLLDLFCCAGGAAQGYHLAGFDVVGVDIFPQPLYQDDFIQADVMELTLDFLRGFDAIHASPPCQAFTRARQIQGNAHPDYVDRVRGMLRRTGKPYIIENVEGAPLLAPVLLCGAMFPGLRTYRHRLFESNVALSAPPHPAHIVPTTKMGRPPEPGKFMHVVGHFSGTREGGEAMGINWMTREGLREAIPPAYTHHLGRQLMEACA